MFGSWNRLRRRIRTWNGAEPTRHRRSVSPQLDGLEGRVVLSRIGLGGRSGLASRIATARATPASFSSLRAGRFGAVGMLKAANPTTTATAVATAATTGAETETTTPTTTTPTLPTTPPQGKGMGGDRGGPEIVPDEQLQAHMETLRTDTEAVLAGSSVTDSQRLALSKDLKAIAEAGFTIDMNTLSAVADSLLAALADGSYDTDAAKVTAIQQSFHDLFTDSSVDSTRIGTTYNDFLAVARGLNVSTEGLQTLNADRAAIQADWERLGLLDPSTDTDTADPAPGMMPQGSNLELILGGVGSGFGGGPGGFGGGRGPGGPGGGFEGAVGMSRGGGVGFGGSLRGYRGR